MQAKCDMYNAAIKERRSRRALMGKDGHEQDTETWRKQVAQAWGEIDSDVDFRDERDMPSLEIVDHEDSTMEDEIK